MFQERDEKNARHYLPVGATKAGIVRVEAGPVIVLR